MTAVFVCILLFYFFSGDVASCGHALRCAKLLQKEFFQVRCVERQIHSTLQKMMTYLGSQHLHGGRAKPSCTSRILTCRPTRKAQKQRSGSAKCRTQVQHEHRFAVASSAEGIKSQKEAPSVRLKEHEMRPSSRMQPPAKIRVSSLGGGAVSHKGPG